MLYRWRNYYVLYSPGTNRSAAVFIIRTKEVRAKRRINGTFAEGRTRLFVENCHLRDRQQKSFIRRF
jgi:hypothetical protein